MKGNRGILAAVVVVGVLATGCGSDGGAKGGGSKAEKLAAGTGVRYGAVRVPVLDKVFAHTMHLEQGYGRNPVGEPKAFTTKELVVKCQQNVSDTFPMTTCFWANHGAIGVVDLFPPDGRHVPVDEAAARTHEFAVGALSTAGAS